VDTRKLIAEALGTFILVVIGSMAIISAKAAAAPILIVVPIGFGLALVAAIAVSGHVSGGHFNPAVTLAAFLDKRIDAANAIGYAVAQVVGAVVASGVILALSDKTAVAGTKNMPGAVGDGGAFLVEVVLSAIFIAVILTVSKRDPGHAILVIPLALVAIHAAGIPLSGASVNPARALGPAIVSLDFAAIWIYLTAPFIGAVIGWLAYRFLAEE